MKLTLDQLIPRIKTRVSTKDVKDFILELDDLVDYYFYHGKACTVKWKYYGLGLTEVWLEYQKNP